MRVCGRKVHFGEIRESHAMSQTASFYKVTKLQDIFKSDIFVARSRTKRFLLIPYIPPRKREIMVVYFLADQ